MKEKAARQVEPGLIAADFDWVFSDHFNTLIDDFDEEGGRPLGEQPPQAGAK
jgi:hypothetical protein